MSTSTPNFHFTKPAASDNVNIADLNGNFDIIDSGVEPVHATQTVTGTNGSITISNALDAPFTDFTVQGAGTPGVYYKEGVTASAQGQQTWDTPLVLDVPVLMGDADFETPSLCYGCGIGNNSYSVIAGTETGTTVYLNSKDLSALFSDLDDSGEGTVTTETSTYLFECPLPFSVATGTTVYCSHLKEQNVADTEGIWASDNTLYLRISTAHCQYDGFSNLARLMDDFAADSLFYMDKGGNPFDFFVCVTASANYTKQCDSKPIRFKNGTQSMLYFTTSMITAEDEPVPITVPTLSATYYTNTAVNISQSKFINDIISERFKTTALGDGASATAGGAVGRAAKETDGGGAIGEESNTTAGGAIGRRASAEYGGAVGFETSTTDGGAVGRSASAVLGGAVGLAAKTTYGAAVGSYAICEDGDGDPIDAIQLGTGTNATAYSMQVYTTPLLTPVTAGTANDGLVIPLSLITASYNAASAADQSAFKQALGIS